jgi:hypothetical protein
MARKQPFTISFDEATKGQLRAIEAKYHSLIRAAIEEQLQFEPETETRNRKPLLQPAPFEATWEIRSDQIIVSAYSTELTMRAGMCGFSPSA